MLAKINDSENEFASNLGSDYHRLFTFGLKHYSKKKKSHPVNEKESRIDLFRRLSTARIL